MQVRYFFHAEPAELDPADRAGHVVAGPVVHFDRKNLKFNNIYRVALDPV